MKPHWLVIIENSLDNILNWISAVEGLNIAEAADINQLKSKAKSLGEKVIFNITHPAEPREIDKSLFHSKFRNGETGIAYHLIDDMCDYKKALIALSYHYNSMICFLDLNLSEDVESNFVNSLDDLPTELKDLKVKAGISIGRHYKPGYNRLLSIASSKAAVVDEAWCKVLNIDDDTRKCYVDVDVRVACTGPDNAKKIIEYSMKKWDATRITDIPIAEMLNLIRRSVFERWDSVTNLHPFHHDLLQQNHKGQKPKHYTELCSYLELQDNYQDDNSFKGLFEFPLSYPEIREGQRTTEVSIKPKAVKTEVLSYLIKKMDIKLVLSGDTANWYFPIKPALPLLLAIREFLNSCDPKPSITIMQQSLGPSSVKVTLNVKFVGECKLQEELESKEKNPDGLSGSCQSLMDLMCARIDPRTKDPWGVLFTGENKPVMEKEWKNNNELHLSWTVSLNRGIQ